MKKTRIVLFGMITALTLCMLGATDTLNCRVNGGDDDDDCVVLCDDD